MRGTGRARFGVALVAAAAVLAGCGGQGSTGAAPSSGGANAGAPGVVARAGDTLAPTSGGSHAADEPAQGSHHDGSAAKPPPGSYDDTSGTRTGTPRAQGAVLAHLPGASRSTCVSVGKRSVVRSGQIGMGSFSQARSVFAQARTPYNAAPSFFYVIPRSRSAAAVTVVASRPGTGQAPVTVRSRHLESAAQWHYFPIHLQIPSRGTWHFSVTVDGDRGCFVASFA